MKEYTNQLNTLLQKWPDFLSNPRLPSSKWVRFHTLPDSKRYPDNESEEKIILQRYNTILSELVKANAIFIINSRWTDSEQPTEEDGNSELGRYWMTIFENPEEDDPELRIYRHLFVADKEWSPLSIDPLLLRVALDQEAGVYIVPDDLSWLCHPYDGGVDVVAPTEADRDLLRSKYADWLSPEPSGL